MENLKTLTLTALIALTSGYAEDTVCSADAAQSPAALLRLSDALIGSPAPASCQFTLETVARSNVGDAQ
ncbi:hypothetical protein [Dinoroseobacter sp. S76]|uniref:hypothetical protein n=1 Tax=Dinoroseobacter sp. S76 TaxID=3415124 RepID=UPI003C7CE2AC